MIEVSLTLLPPSPIIFSYPHSVSSYIFNRIHGNSTLDGRKEGREGRVAKRTDYVSRWSVV